MLSSSRFNKKFPGKGSDAILLQVVTLMIHDTTTMVGRSDALLMFFISLVCQAMRLCSLYVNTLIDHLKAEIFYEDMIKMCVFYGCQILVENNKVGNTKVF